MVKLIILRDVSLAIVGATLLSALLVSMTNIHPAGAQMAAPMTKPPDELRQACAKDVRILCAGIQPGGGRIKQCFIAKRDQLSDGCKSALLEARAMSAK